jgi:DNA-binding MarR family transcriptional regulator
MTVRDVDDPGLTELETWGLPALLRGARGVFRSSIRRALDQSECDDLPPNGPYVLSAVARAGAPLSSVILQLGVSKQSAGQLVDSLVARGYLDRAVDPGDRRRLVVRPTERGEAAAKVIRAAVDAVVGDLEARVGATRVTEARAVLAALISIGRSDG